MTGGSGFFVGVENIVLREFSGRRRGGVVARIENDGPGQVFRASLA